MTTYILGLATMGESAAALLRDGQLVAAAEEERFSRFKHEGCFPVRAIEFCLRSQGITLQDVQHIGVYWQPWRIYTRAKGVLGSLFRRPKSFAGKLSRTFEELSPAGGGDEPQKAGSWFELFRVRQILTQRFGKFRGRIRYYDHHLCHMASAFFTSPFEEATLLTFDGAGEEASTTLAVGSGSEIRVLRQIDWPHSLGHFYASMTGFLGFKMLDGEYKMMGLAPYNEPSYRDYIRSNILVSDTPGSYRLRSGILDYHEALAGRFSAEAVRVFGEPRKNDDEPFTERHQRIAASAQAAFEDVCADLAAWAFEAGGRKADLCIAGGCGLNGTSNGKLLRNGPFERLFVPPVPHDAGGALGAALLLHCVTLGQPRVFRMSHACYGPSFDDTEVAKALSAAGLRQPVPIRTEADLIERTVATLTGGGVVAWFQGGMEYGPRALGARSFLADPRHDSIRDTMNERIKKRELFRPFAPSVKEECAPEFFELDQPSPFMNIVTPVRKEKAALIPAVTHVDGTARIQTVSRSAHPRYWNLIDAFQKKTGVPVLLNTSFNIQEPIVCTPAEAVATFRRSKVDALAIQNRFVVRGDFS